AEQDVVAAATDQPIVSAEAADHVTAGGADESVSVVRSDFRTRGLTERLLPRPRSREDNSAGGADEGRRQNPSPTTRVRRPQPTREHSTRLAATAQNLRRQPFV